MAIPAGRKPNSTSKSAAVPQPNTIHFNAEQLGEFLDAREKGDSSGKGGAANRVFVRWPYRVATVTAKFVHPGGSESSVTVACRNLSAGGIGILHRTFLHKGTKCVLSLPDTRGNLVNVPGIVVRCIHVQGTIHELGVQFAKPVRARDFVMMDPFADGFSFENVKPEDLKGTILYLDDSALDQSLVRHFLRETQMRLLVAEDRKAAVEKIAEGVDLILCDYNLANDNGAQVVQSLRADGVTSPIIMVTADTSKQTRDAMMNAEANAFISKPLSAQTLFRAIAEFIVVGTSSSAFISSLPMDHPNRGLLTTFVQQVRDYAKSMEQALESNALDKCRTLCLQVGGAAPVMGFDRLAAVAKDAEKSLAGMANAGEVSGPLRRLIDSCRKVSDRAA
jgi:CheY-like chemotaxis protein/HPt (histidine-containing phosphotransfer) domain-containing protein